MATLSAIPAAKDDWHDRWLKEMNKEYTRRLSTAKTAFVDRCSRTSGRSTATEESGCEASGNAPVYYPFTAASSSAGHQWGRSAATWWCRCPPVADPVAAGPAVASRLPSGYPRTPRWTRSGSGAARRCCSVRSPSCAECVRGSGCTWVATGYPERDGTVAHHYCEHCGPLWRPPARTVSGSIYYV